MESIAPSELILNADGSIYHLNLRPDDIADTIIIVGDPNRVTQVSRHFDGIDIIKQKREFLTHTGHYQGHRLTVMSTGMGAGNIDIFMNEIDALVSIDFEKRQIKRNPRSLNIIRLGTSGSLHPTIVPGEIVISELAIGLDAAMAYYAHNRDTRFDAYLSAKDCSVPHHYITSCSSKLNEKILPEAHRGITLTAPGFYAAQNRSLRLPYAIEFPFDDIHQFTCDGIHITNMEMETACLYLMGELLGHHILSVNCILANRISGQFSANPKQEVNSMIEQFLHSLVESDVLD